VATLLVIDDSADVRLLLRRALERAGHVIIEAASGPEGVAVLQTTQPDLVVLDVQMPEMDGWECLSTLRSQPQSADVPVVLCTVKSHDNDARRASELGCDAYLTKPFGLDELLATVTTVLGMDPRQRAANRARWLTVPRNSLTQEAP
jgi:CheY-like chemotaxis protein